MKYSTVLFDIDGTLIGLEPVIKGIIEICRRMDFEIPSEQEIKQEIIPATFQDYFRKRYNLDDAQVKRTENIYMNFYSRHGNSYARLFPSVNPVFAALRENNIKIGIITNKLREEAKITLDHFNLNADVVITQEDVFKKKPDPEPILEACGKLWVRRQACIYVGDCTVGMQAAKAAGCTTVGVTTGCNSREELLNAGADKVIDDLQELLEMVI